MPNQKHFQIPVTKFGSVPPEFVGNLNVTYDGETGEIIVVTWRDWDSWPKTAIHDLLQAIAPDFWDEIVTAKNAHMEAALELSEKIEDEND